MASKEKKLRPTFDFTKVGREWQDKFADSAEIVSRLLVNAERPLRRQKADEDNEEYDDYVQAFYDAKEQSGKQLREEGNKQADLVCDVLVNVPREWLLPNAPESIDWSNPASLDLIQVDHYLEILDMVRTGEARKQAKN